MSDTPLVFTSEHESHNHSLITLSALNRHMDFMRSIDTMADVGCGTGTDLEWWATRTYFDDDERELPMNIKCTGIDLRDKLSVAQQYDNINYQRRDFETAPAATDKFDVLWCHDAFQYAANPLQTLRHFHTMLNDDGMLAIVIPQTTNVVFHKQEFVQTNFQYFHYTIVNLIHMLAVSGFDTRSGFYKKDANDPWMHAVVYKSDIAPMDPRTTTWVDLAEQDLLSDSAKAGVYKCGHLRQEDLVTRWLNHSNATYKY